MTPMTVAIILWNPNTALQRTGVATCNGRATWPRAGTSPRERVASWSSFLCTEEGGTEGSWTHMPVGSRVHKACKVIPEKTASKQWQTAWACVWVLAAKEVLGLRTRVARRSGKTL